MNNNEDDGNSESTPLLLSPRAVTRLKFPSPIENEIVNGSIRRRGNQKEENITKVKGSNILMKVSSSIRVWGSAIFSSQTKKQTGFETSQFNDDMSQNSSLHEIEYYDDKYNDLPWRCTFGTTEDDGVWLNQKDMAGIIMSITVWVLLSTFSCMVYSYVTVTLLAQNNSLPSSVATFYCTICALSLATHAKSAFTDPGTVPQSAVPTEEGSYRSQHPYCSKCQAYKPPTCHHCRICDRCICGMDHHCPWMNNCIGAGNLKHFILFLLYTWCSSSYALVVFGYNYFLCNSDTCIFPDGLIQLVRVMSVLCMGTLLFTSCMLINVTFGIMTGMLTIDQMKKKANHTLLTCDNEPIPLKDVFGIGPLYTWPFPIDPIFDDHDRIMGYSTTHQLLREKEFWASESNVMSAGSQSFCQV